MKKCPRCGQLSFDANQNFCLNDGETLVFPNDSQPTMRIDPKSFSTQTVMPEKQGVNAGFAYATIILLSLLIGGGIVALVLINPFAPKTETANLAQNQQNTVVNSALATGNEAANQPLVSVPHTTPKPVIVKVPVATSGSESFGFKNYSGNVGGNNASFNMDWNANKTISGSYYLNSNPSEIFTVSGTNYIDGISELRVSSNGNLLGQLKLNKTLTETKVCWEGYLSAGNQFIKFCRNRTSKR